MSFSEKYNKYKILLITISLGIISGIIMILFYLSFSNLIIHSRIYIFPVFFVIIPYIIWKGWQFAEFKLIQMNYAVHFFFIECLIPMTVTISLLFLYFYNKENPIGVFYGVLYHIVMIIAMIEMNLLKISLNKVKINKKCDYVDFVRLGVVFAWCIVQLPEMFGRRKLDNLPRQEYLSVLINLILGIAIGILVVSSILKKCKDKDKFINFSYKTGVLFSIITFCVTSGVFALFILNAPY